MSGSELDPAVIERRLHHLARAVARLQEYRGLSITQLEADDWSVLHGLQSCIQAVLDISAYLITASGTPMPDQYRSGLKELGRMGVVPEAFAERIAAMAGFRNVVVHEYLDVDMAIVKSILDERLDDLKEFGRYVSEYLERMTE